MNHKASYRLIVLVTGLCFTGLILRTLFPAVNLPRIDVPLYVLVMVISQMGEAGPSSMETMLFRWGIAAAAMTLFPAVTGLNTVPLWQSALTAAGSAAFVILAMEAMEQRSYVRKAGTSGRLVNGALLFLAVQGFQAVFIS